MFFTLSCIDAVLICGLISWFEMEANIADVNKIVGMLDDSSDKEENYQI